MGLLESSQKLVLKGCEKMRQYIAMLKRDWVGKRVLYLDGEIYTVVDVDANGALMIDKKARFTETTAVATYMVQEIG